MAKITLGNRPATVFRNVTVQLPDGSDGEVGVHYKYRTRTEFGAFVDDFFKPSATPAAAGQATSSDADASPAFSARAMQLERVESNARYLVAVIDHWDLDIPFSHEAALQLCDENPGVATRLMDAYRDAITEGRLGN